MDYAELCERFIAARFPAADIAVIGGSSSRGERTPTSDIDLLLIGSDLFDDERTAMAATFGFEGEVFEVFAYTPTGFEEWARLGVEQHRPVIVNILVEGTPVRRGADFDGLHRAWSTVLAAGPEIEAHQRLLRRYQVTDVLDDLRDATDPLEQHVLAGTLFRMTAELMLLEGGHWIGTGKYLPRRLRELSAPRTDALSDPLLRGDLSAFAYAVEQELDAAGGRVQTGFVR